MNLYEEEKMVFDVYYAGIVAMNCHPGTTRDAAPGRSLAECAQIALDMIQVRRSIMGWET